MCHVKIFMLKQSRRRCHIKYQCYKRRTHFYWEITSFFILSVSFYSHNRPLRVTTELYHCSFYLNRSSYKYIYIYMQWTPNTFLFWHPEHLLTYHIISYSVDVSFFVLLCYVKHSIHSKHVHHSSFLTRHLANHRNIEL